LTNNAPAHGPTLTDDPWQRVVTAAAGDMDAAEYRGRGRVLRVKLGYNPNSSSVGSVIAVLMWTATFGAVALNVITAIVARDARHPSLPPPDDES
jgi:hypothetical protein